MTNMKIFLGCIVALFFCGSAQATQRLDSLLVYGQDFIFSVKEPGGWMADTVHAAVYQCNILIYPKSQTWQDPNGMIRIRVDDKIDERVDKDLAADMNDYRNQFPNIQFKDIAVSHPRYRIYSKVFYVENNFYEYVAYINPGPQSALMFSVAMNTQKTEATQSELATLQKVITSLQMLKSP